MSSHSLRNLRGVLLAVGLAGSAVSCGGSGATDAGPTQPEPPATTFVCTGAVPENAIACPGTSTGLTADTPRVVMALCQTTPCSYVCNPGFLIIDGACRPTSAPEDVHFVDNGDGTVSMTDAYGTTVWLKNANCLEPLGGIARGTEGVLWTESLEWTAALSSGGCGLTDGSVPGDWTLPTVSQLLNLATDLGIAGDPAWRLFDGVQETPYWSAFSNCVGYQAGVDIRALRYEDVKEQSRLHVWPIRATLGSP